jgi:hypothetical protein
MTPDLRRRAMGLCATAALRVAGLLAVLVATVFGAATRPDPLWTNLAVSLGGFGLVGFLWLALSGFFGYGSFDRRDWVGFVPFLVALAVRQIFTLHSVEGLEIQFTTQFEPPYGTGKHSLLYPLLQLFLVPIVPDTQPLLMTLNGCLGALTALSVYLFVRQRTGDRLAGFLAALFFATHPLVARFAPTDGPYSLLLAAWFSGLVLLSASRLEARALIGGACLLAIAATLRLEGVLLLLGSLVMLDMRALLDAALRNGVAAAAGVVLIAALGALQMVVFLPTSIGGTLMYFREGTALQNTELLLWPMLHHGAVFTASVAAGVLAGVVTRQRLGLASFVAMLLVIAPVMNSTHASALHRLVPACALLAVTAGMGAHALAAWALAAGHRWLAAAPALAALYVLVAGRADLTRAYVFNEEYDLVRSHLAAGAGSDCRLLHFSAQDDEDVHNFRAVTPDMPVLDCRRDDCRAALSGGGCLYYLRSIVSYFHAGGVPASCAESATAATGCLVEPIASFETSTSLEPVEVRMIEIHGTFPEWARSYPRRAEIGVFRVRTSRSEELQRDTGERIPGP